MSNAKSHICREVHSGRLKTRIAPEPCGDPTCPLHGGEFYEEYRRMRHRGEGHSYARKWAEDLARWDRERKERTTTSAGET